MISALTIPTCDRIASLERSLSWYVENSLKHERSIDFVVMDDARGANARKLCREMLRELVCRYDVQISHCGLEQKLLFAKKLIGCDRVPPEVIKFALFDSDGSGLATLGANRNAILLHTAGNLILSSDDDVHGPLAVAAGMSDEIAPVRDSPPSEEFRIYPDRESALHTVTVVEADILATQERYLGRHITACLNGNGKPENNDDHRTSSVHLHDPAASVMITTNGYVGDNGFGSPSVYLEFLGDSFAHLTRSEADYRAACSSRQTVQFVKQVTITGRAETMMAGCVGIDNRQLTPPFLPIGRGEDHLFGLLVSKCFDAGHFACLPQLLHHTPMESRQTWPGEISRRASGLDLHTLFSVLFDAHADPQTADPRERLAGLGHFLTDLGLQPWPSFDKFLRARLREWAEAGNQRLERRLQKRGDAPEYWAKDVKKYIAIKKEWVTQDECTTPLELLYGHDPEQARQLTQKLVCNFGQLLIWWPALLQTARELREEETFLAQTV